MIVKPKSWRGISRRVNEKPADEWQFARYLANCWKNGWWLELKNPLQWVLSG